MQDTTKTYGKYVLAGAVGFGLGAGAFTVADTPTEQTQTYQNLQDKLDTAQNDNEDLEEKIEDLNTTVTDKEERVSNLEDQVTQFNNTVEELRAENADLEDAVATAQERVGLVDYLPVFSDEDVEFDTGGLSVEVDQEAHDGNGEGDYDRITANYGDDNGGNYDVIITEYEESEDADEAVEDFRETNSPVEFTEDGDTHTVETTGYTGEMEKVQFEYSDADAVEDVDYEDDVESVTVDGEDITDRVETVETVNDGSDLRITFDESYYVNDGDKVSVSYSDASSEGDFEEVRFYDGNSWTSDAGDYQYDQSSDTREDVYRDGNTVVEVTGDRTGDSFEAQYADLTSQYE